MEQNKFYQLLARKMADELLPAEEAALEIFLQQNPQAAYLHEILLQQWQNAEETTAASKKREERHQQRLQDALQQTSAPPLTTVATGTAKRMLPYFGIAASILLLVTTGIIYWYYLYPKQSLRIADAAHIQTPKGIRSHIILPDSSIIWLNAGSKLDYKETFGITNREITLEGEAFFEVKSNAKLPFIVKTKAFSILVLGTSFNVRAYPEEDSAVTSLIKGAVNIMLEQKGGKTISLRPNEKLTVLTPTLTTPVNATQTNIRESINNNNNNVKISNVTEMKDSIIAETAWVQNKLVFKHLPLEQVVQLLEQWYGTEIRFASEKNKHLNFSGVFEGEPLEQVLSALELTTPTFQFTKDKKGVIWIK